MNVSFEKRQRDYEKCASNISGVQQHLLTLTNKLESLKQLLYASCQHEKWNVERLYDHKIYTCVKCGKEK
jgi:hypothetical protein